MHASNACDRDMKQQSPLHDTADSTAERTDKVAPRAAKRPGRSPQWNKDGRKTGKWEKRQPSEHANGWIGRFYSAAIEGEAAKQSHAKWGAVCLGRGQKGEQIVQGSGSLLCERYKREPFRHSPFCSDWKNAMMG